MTEILKFNKDVKHTYSWKSLKYKKGTVQYCKKVKKQNKTKQTPPFGMFGMASRNVSLYNVEI